MVPITQEIKSDLRWWLSEERLLEGKPLHPLSPDLGFYSDSLDLGWGTLLGNQEVSGKWSLEEQNLHINVQELKALHLGLQSFLSIVYSKTMVVHVDSTMALTYI